MALTAARLDQLATKLDQPSSAMAQKAIEEFVTREEWIIADIEARLREADAGDFASESEVEAVLSKYLKRAG